MDLSNKTFEIPENQKEEKIMQKIRSEIQKSPNNNERKSCYSKIVAENYQPAELKWPLEVISP